MNKPNKPSKASAALDFKSAALYALRAVLHNPELNTLKQALDQRMQEAGSFFENEPVVLDASQLAPDANINWADLIRHFQQHRLHPIGVLATNSQLEAAQKAGLPPVDLSNLPQRPPSQPAPVDDVPKVTPQPTTAQTKPVNPTEPQQPALAPAALIIDRQLRSGQRVYARDTDLIVLGVVGQGAEVIADGNIHVYGPLRGKAMAGARGDTSARIFTTELDAELVAIAGIYQVIETQLPDELHKQAACIQLDGDSLEFTRLEAKR
ncbi:MAG TPA: septum site-determining protein MinC [Burkholderiaceae bacterium]|nr:septum site-determining protein MinC [Burkholderiaceae bacterium]